MKNIDIELLVLLSSFAISIILIFIGVLIYAGIGPALVTFGACLFLTATSYATFSRG